MNANESWGKDKNKKRKKKFYDKPSKIESPQTAKTKKEDAVTYPLHEIENSGSICLLSNTLQSSADQGMTFESKYMCTF